MFQFAFLGLSIGITTAQYIINILKDKDEISGYLAGISFALIGITIKYLWDL